MADLRLMLYLKVQFVLVEFVISKFVLEPDCCKKQQKIVTGLWRRGRLKDLKDSKLILNKSKLFP